MIDQENITLFNSLQETAVGFYLIQFGFIKTSKGDLKYLGFGQMELDFYHKRNFASHRFPGLCRYLYRYKRRHRAQSAGGQHHGRRYF